MAEKMTSDEGALYDLIAEIDIDQRAIIGNIGDPRTRDLLFEATLTAVAGVVVGGLVGALLGTRRRLRYPT
ncbi:hypothetical protein [Nannocystis pusilla]|uniref:Uncharacterized protein n=1 Tax=Nannocystis pusilla TaxID=889268 RepID=A0ABS7TN88_9BACT|nr:hypothetical protein [Nannocystis pusilla]MBZ5709670.1 hypothetical protein [Nannocystis pusilla]